MRKDSARFAGEHATLVALQRGVPLVPRPFAAVGREVGISEEAVLARLRELFDGGLARRFGAVFDSRSLGYGSTLCAADVPPPELERAAALLAPHAGVTHCYEREGRPNLWFTLTARADAFDAELRALAGRLAPVEVLNLPALRRFKVEVVLDAPGDGPSATAARGAAQRGVDVATRGFSERDKALIRALQGNLAATAAPFDEVAAALGWDRDALLGQLAAWHRTGILRRIGVILRHRSAGFVANGMCVWRAAPDEAERAGALIARCPEVTHCYERPAGPSFPYNLFAMVHARRREVAQDLFRKLSERAGLRDGAILMSVREFKKSSPVFFCEEGRPAGDAR